MDIFGKINPLPGGYDHSTFQATFEALLRESFEDVGIIAIGKGYPSKSHTADLHLDVAELVAETTKVLADALQELSGYPVCIFFDGTKLLVERVGFNSKIDAFVEQRLQWREDALTKAQHDAEQHDIWLHQSSEESYEDTSEDWRLIRDASGTVVDYNYAD